MGYGSSQSNDLLNVSGVIDAIMQPFDSAIKNRFRLQSLIGYACILLSIIGLLVSMIGAYSNVDRYTAIFLFFVVVLQVLASVTDVKFIHFLVTANIINALGFNSLAFSHMFYGAGSKAYGWGLQIEIIAALLSCFCILQLWEDPIAKIKEAAVSIYGALSFAIYVIIWVGAIIAQSQDHTMFRFTGPALGIALFFLISRCFPIRGLPVVVISLLTRMFVEACTMAALYQQVTGKSTIPAGLGIIGAGVFAAMLLLIVEELLKRSSIQETFQTAFSDLQNLFVMVPVVLSVLCFLGTLGSYFAAVAAMSAAYSNMVSFLLMAGVMGALFHVVGLVLDSKMALYSSFGFMLFLVPEYARILSVSQFSSSYAQSIAFLTSFLLFSICFCHRGLDGHITSIRASFSRSFLPHTLILLSSIFQFIGCILLFADKSFSKDAYLYISITNFLFIFMLFVLVSTDSGDFEYLVISVCGVLLLFTLQLAMTATSSVAVAGAVLCYIGCIFAATWLVVRHLSLGENKDESTTAASSNPQPVLTHVETAGAPSEATALIY